MSIESFDYCELDPHEALKLETAELVLRALGINVARRNVIIAEAWMNTKIINAIKQRLEHSQDAAHNLDHHEAVVANCIYILNHESSIGSPYTEALEIAAWAHDIERGDLKANNIFVRNTMKVWGAEPDLIGKVIEIINTHSFGNKQQKLEAKVLYDADKIEYVSELRAEAALKAVKRGEMSQEKLNGYLEDWKNRIPEVRKSMHFESSKRLFDKKFEETALHFKGDPVLSFMYTTWYNLYHAHG